MSNSGLEQINECLGRYYKLHGRDDFFNNKGKGKFITWCVDNGFDNETLMDEFNEDPEDCMIVTFDCDDDDNNLFPLKPPIDDERETAKAIIKVIKKCYQNANAYKNGLDEDNDDHKHDGTSIPEINSQFFKLSTSDQKSAEKTLKTQTPYIYEQGIETDDTLKMIMAVGHKNKFPYLTLLCDMYSRDFAEGKFKKVKDPGQWAKSHPHFKMLKNLKTKKKNSIFELTEAALKSYFHRVCPRIRLPRTTKIVDSIKDVAEYIDALILFINNLAKQKQQVVPFQMDTCFAFGEVTANEIQSNDDDNNSDDSVEDTDYDTDDMSGYRFVDKFGDIEAKLKDNKLKYFVKDVDDNKNNTKQRMVSDSFQKLKNEMNEDTYPQQRRFCAIVDRRKLCDKFYIIHPPNDCNKIPRGFVHEWFFNASNATILPQKGYGKGGFHQQRSKNNIHARSECSAASMVISFHVFAVDEIRCYLYCGNSVTRFMPQDITNLLGKLFVESNENKAFQSSKTASDMVNRLKIPDTVFTKFIAAAKKKK